MAVSNKMGSTYPCLERGGLGSSVTGTTLQLDSNFVNATSGEAVAMRFSAPISQTNAAFTAYAFMTAKSGSPTAMKVAVFAGPSGAMDAQRPSTAAALGTSSAVDVSAQTDQSWTTFSIASLSLTAGETYWLVLYNDTATPESNYATYMIRGLSVTTSTSTMSGFTTADGFTTDPPVVSISNGGLFVIKFSDGSLLGTPYTKSNTHAYNANDRGNRYRFDADTVVNGIFNIFTSSLTTHVKVYKGAVEVASVTLDLSQQSNSQSIFFDAQITFVSGEDYDVVYKYSGSTTAAPRIDAGTSPPADVISCMPAGLSCVDGSTPGSYTESDGFITTMFLLVDNIPTAPVGGGETSHVFIG